MKNVIKPTAVLCNDICYRLRLRQRTQERTWFWWMECAHPSLCQVQNKNIDVIGPTVNLSLKVSFSRQPVKRCQLFFLPSPPNCIIGH